MELITCKSCGGSVIKQGRYYLCESCGNKWIADLTNDVYAVERVNAWNTLRNGDFERAVELFEEIIAKEKSSHEAYFGRALALNGIMYVNDVREDKKVPTCNNISESSFLADKDVKKAISLAPEEIRKSYQEQAERIEKIRVEWLEKASKEPPYDIFISFKDSDRENGIDRTQDSYDAQELYTSLVDLGYKVFFSRVSLRDKVSEQYEPYIYNAIRTAKVMIVFGEKPEYFNSTWIKNEWSRFRARIEKGEKHKNSLVVVYKNMNAIDLPFALKARQALNMGDITFLETLKKHIKRVIDESQQVIHLDKIEIKGGQIAKKATSLTVNTIQMREIGTGVAIKTDITEKQTLSLVDTYMKANSWEDAQRIIDDVLFNNPSCAEAMWKQLLIKYRVVDNSQFFAKITALSSTDLQIIDEILSCANQKLAIDILDLLYSSMNNLAAEEYFSILQVILPYKYNHRYENIQNAFNLAIDCGLKNVFDLLITTLRSNQVDLYINYNLRYAQKTLNNLEKIECLNNILEVNEGNLEVLNMLLYSKLENNEQSKNVIKTFEEVLKYSNNHRKIIDEILAWLEENLNSSDDCDLVKEVLRYSTDDISTFKDQLIRLSVKMITNGFFSKAEYFCKLILQFDALNTSVFWNICLIKVQAKTDQDIVFSKIPLRTVPEYIKYLTLVDEKRRLKCIEIEKEQNEYFSQAKREKEAKDRKQAEEERARTQKRIEEQRLKKLEKEKEAVIIRERIKNIIKVVAVLSCIIAIIVSITVCSNKDTKSRNGCKFEKTGAGYVVVGLDKKHAEEKEIVIPSTYRGKPVISIGEEAFYNCKALTNVVIPDSITTIGKKAFQGSSLVAINIPDSVTTIGEDAFRECRELTSAVIPGSVILVDDYAFFNCDSLKNVEIGNGVEKMGMNIFRDCDSLTSVVIPDSVTLLDSGIFYECKSLTSVVMSKNLIAIDDYTFYNCTSLTSVIIPEGVTMIEESVFQGCISLTSIEIPESVKSISQYAFKDCTSLTGIVIPEGVVTISGGIFQGCTSLASISIGNNVSSICSSAFEDCTSLTSIIIPDSVYKIEYNAFKNCSLLTIYCEVESIPSRWDQKWNVSNCPVVLGYKG